MTRSAKIVVIDYGAGNIWSVVNSLEFLGANCLITSNPKMVLNADVLVLPGVGSFRTAMVALHERMLFDAIQEAVNQKKRKILGICLGFQMLTNSSSEDGKTLGLGFISGDVNRFDSLGASNRKLPHIGFNEVRMPSSSSLFSGFGQTADFYFVHSYKLPPQGVVGSFAICNYGSDFIAAYQRDNVFGAQFHPEKSQTNGLRFLSNFLIA